MNKDVVVLRTTGDIIQLKDAIQKSMTVGELMRLLSCYDPDSIAVIWTELPFDDLYSSIDKVDVV